MVDTQTQESKPPIKQSNRTKLPVIVLSVGIFILFSLASLFVLTTSALGKNNPFSALTRIISVEQLNWLNRFRKSDSQLVIDALASQADKNLAMKLGGRESQTQMKLDIATERSIDTPAFTLEANFTTNFAMPAKADIYKIQSKLKTTVSSGVFSFDSGDDGIQIDLLVPDKNQLFAKLHVSDKIKNTLFPFFSQGKSQTSNSGTAEFEKYLDKFFLVDIYKIMSYDNEVSSKSNKIPLPSLDPQKSREAASLYVTKLEPEMLEFMKKFTGKLISSGKVKLLPRQKIAGQESLVFSLEIDQKALPDLTLEAFKEWSAIFISHREDFIAYCESMTPVSVYGPDCQDRFTTLENDLTFDSSSGIHRDLKESFDQVFKLFSLKSLNLFINPVDNTLLKMETNIEMNKEEFAKLAGPKAPLINKFNLNYTYEELTRGKNFTLDVPSDAPDLVDELKKLRHSSSL